MTVNDKARRIRARDAVEAIRGPLTNAQILERFKITQKGFADLLRQLLTTKLITEEDLNQRGIRVKVIRKEAEITTPSLSPSPDETGEEFLDTVSLTEMLTVKSVAPKIPGKEVNEKHHAESARAEPGEDKKSKLRPGGLFKKRR